MVFTYNFFFKLKTDLNSFLQNLVFYNEQIQLLLLIVILKVFQFEGHQINLDLKVGIFITMNPGYAGRTELPESVKALFRPVVCIVPDLELICLIMLFSEGFLQAKVNQV